MQRCFYFLKADFPKFFKLLTDFGSVHAPVPVSDKSFGFCQVTDLNDIALEATRTILPPKKFLFLPEEEILKYRDGEF